MIITGPNAWRANLLVRAVDGILGTHRQEPRHVGTIEPLWNLFDFTREGRPANWHEQFSY